MPLFDQILGAINNPNQQASSDQLGTILNTLQQVAGNQGTNTGTTQAAMSVVGSYVRSALKQKASQGGAGQVDSIMRQFAGTGPNPAAVQALFNPSQQQQLTQTISQRTGLNASQIQGLLVVLVPIALKLLSSGAQQGQGSAVGGNSVLGAFMDADGDGDVDMGDALSMAGRYLNHR
ncbi:MULTISPECIES: DUF937 domain-containing protein [unclassified Leptolyngbya]|uniref:DUF937 domain-containing protein n=1 Tax=unclassified Leptolyngbya TaxID=2650499 RepID=UPI0016882014|nr:MULTISPECIES: DUF937 domain-containing protein [unclassified Leptolyngbya]MBD1912296.1 hypothetical protein [Leptolyngbya sp. FACHB-8]MBD2153865.1 hypothetical protein [Leptolyngbya sp. FACHB-16]